MRFLIIVSGGGDYSAQAVERHFKGKLVSDVLNTGIFDDGGEKFNSECDDDDIGIKAEILDIDISGNVATLMQAIRNVHYTPHCGVWSEKDIF